MTRKRSRASKRGDELSQSVNRTGLDGKSEDESVSPDRERKLSIGRVAQRAINLQRMSLPTSFNRVPQLNNFVKETISGREIHITQEDAVDDEFLI